MAANLLFYTEEKSKGSLRLNPYKCLYFGYNSQTIVIFFTKT
jgi:hypothetical protein